jgi:hypothetical protein
VLEQAAALLGSGGGVHHVVVVDGSYSMGAAQDGGGSAFDRARNLVGRLLDRCEADAGRGAKVTLVFAGVRPRFLCRGDLDLATVRGQWQQMQKPEDAAGDLGEALAQTAAWLDEAKDPQTRVYVLTDMQARALGAALPDPARAAGPELTDTARDVVEALQKRPGTKLSWIDVGPFAGARQGGTLDNVQIAELRIAQPAAVTSSSSCACEYFAMAACAVRARATRADTACAAGDGADCRFVSAMADSRVRAGLRGCGGRRRVDLMDIIASAGARPVLLFGQDKNC